MSFRIKFLFLAYMASLMMVKGQDMHFSQFYSSPVYLNPALAGLNVCSRATLVYRNQWPGISKAFNSYLFSSDHFIADAKIGAGMLMAHDEAGSGNLMTTIVSPTLAYELRVSQEFGIRFGIQPGLTQKRINYKKLVFGDQIARGGDVSTIEDSKPSKTYFDAGTGIFFYTKQYWGGFALNHINQPNESLTGTTSRLPVKYTLHGGYSHLLNADERDELKRKSITSVFHYRHQKKFDQFDYGLYYRENVFTVGLWYRGLNIVKRYRKGYQNNDALCLILGLQNKRTSFGYSYDITISKLANVSQGAHEVTVSYQLCNPKKKKKIRLTVDCPKF
ncbi:MAG TPA: type IX secretion system membrane protein PorP/SprF [Bacteroidia bacterium]|nr:type IX secretion system membrane protein PorP/SprF [Bacteroidia bacterium]HRH08881.1 type IX secretion system membrane protein PorP/SprF [Bacteroidia bacterium]HRH63332.1 type IX secretion system membrane protein PorP/SprF [Bacteroidia bacterium]